MTVVRDFAQSAQRDIQLSSCPRRRASRTSSRHGS